MARKLEFGVGTRTERIVVSRTIRADFQNSRLVNRLVERYQLRPMGRSGQKRCGSAVGA